MRASRDIAIAIMVSVLGLIYAVTIGQLPIMIIGIAGSNYLVQIGYAILVGFALLMYEGRRWRLLLQGVLVTLLFLPTSSTGQAFDIFSRLPTLGAAFFQMYCLIVSMDILKKRRKFGFGLSCQP